MRAPSAVWRCAAVAVADGDDPLDAGASTRSARPTGAIAIAVRPPSSRRSAELPIATWPLAVCESEQNTITSAPSRAASAARPCGVERSVTTWRSAPGVPSSSTPLVEHALRLGLRDLLAVAVGLGVVAHVRERHLGAGAAEEAAQRDGVLLVGGAVVGNDDLGGH